MIEKTKVELNKMKPVMVTKKALKKPITVDTGQVSQNNIQNKYMNCLTQPN